MFESDFEMQARGNADEGLDTTIVDNPQNNTEDHDDNGEHSDGTKVAEGGGNGAENTSGEGTDGSSDNSDEYIVLRLNGDEVRTLNRDEATHYAQRGIELESVYQKLDYVAVSLGVTVDEFLKNQLDSREDAYRKELETKVSDPATLEELMGLYRTREKEKYEQVILGRKTEQENARQTKESKVADDFLKLQQEFPEVADFKSLPEGVKKAAARGENLLGAYLLHLHREGQAVKKAEENAKVAAKASTGSMNNAAGGNEESFSDFRKALFGM